MSRRISAAVCAILLVALEALGANVKQIAVLETTQGTIEIELLPEIAPKAVENFTTHIKNGYYDGLIFHRVIKDFMIQGGDPTGTGRGGESIWGAPFEDEFNAAIGFNEPYLLAMANAGPKTNGSQVFITTVKTEWLNNRHTIFGRVIKGQEVVKKIESVPADRSNKPIDKQEIKKATIKEVKAK
ncbi:MAG: peptidylprolyl isomerase [Helicobacteraceae bacterium]|jgi:peptidylprolyl isomerase|nr:peptidylprolyl isomerase [Helicobacteraceae bacterium]